MIKVTFELEDSKLVAKFSNDEGKWNGYYINHSYKLSQYFTWSESKMSAALALMSGIGEDNVRLAKQETIQDLYSIVEEAIKEWPDKLRPMP